MPKVLVIDDDPGFLAALRRLFEFKRRPVETLATDGEAARTLMARERIGLVILDVMLSGVDGRDVARELKARSETKHIPIIMISANPSFETSAREAGAEAFIAKPFSIADLLGLADRYLGAAGS